MSSSLSIAQPTVMHQFAEQLLQLIGGSHELLESQARVTNLTALTVTLRGQLQAANQTICSLGSSCIVLNVIGVAITAFALYKINTQGPVNDQVQGDRTSFFEKHPKHLFTALSALGLGIVLYSTFSTAMAIASAKSAIGVITAAAV